MTPDINVLVAASRADHVHHRAATKWLNEALAACETGASIEILPMISAGFLRLVTNERVFRDPTPIDEATEFIEVLLSMTGVEVPRIGGEWPVLRRWCCDMALAGNAIPDAWIAAAVRTNDSHLVTFDRGFAALLTKRELTILPAS